MDAMKMIKERRSVRKYTEELVSHEVINEIIDAARWAPSWANFQIARYTIVEDQDIIQDIAINGVQGFSYNTGTLKNTKQLVILSYVQGKSGKLTETDYATEKGNVWEMFDAGIACQTFCLAAHEKGVGTCIFGVINDEVIAKAINLLKGETVGALITMGYPNEIAKATPRKEVEQITRFI